MAFAPSTDWIFSLLLCAGLCYAGHEWSYKGNLGPKHWHELFPEACSGKMQSPININPEETMYDPNLKDFAVFYDPPKPNAKMFVKNNGHSVQIDTEGDFFVTNGGLGHVYKTVQFHFHWGHDNNRGSEHFIEGQPFPLEMHVVNYNHDLYENIAQAATQPMGLAVLGVLFEISDKENKAMKPILKAIKKVQDPDKEATREIKAMSIRDVLPADTTRYFRYNGSLTTPGCFESVIWTVFQDKQTISLDQILEFRAILKPKKSTHKKKKGDHKKPRSRRSRSKESKNEKQAEKVIDELGIRGDPVQETELEAAMMEKKLDKEMAVAVADTTSPELDEESARQAEENMMKHVIEKQNGNEHGSYNVEEPFIEYIREKLVNNFRPIQDRNNRNIYRSFKLNPKYDVNPGKTGKSVDYYSSSMTLCTSFFTLIATLVYTYLVVM